MVCTGTMRVSAVLVPLIGIDAAEGDVAAGREFQ